MMLDPTLLSSKSSEPSLPTSENLQDGSLKATETKKPEAEVRLVFKITVEEQLIYNGRIERTQLLDSEELSRVVSRVVWDESKTKDDLVVDSGACVVRQTNVDIETITNESSPGTVQESSLHETSPDVVSNTSEVHKIGLDIDCDPILKSPSNQVQLDSSMNEASQVLALAQDAQSTRLCMVESIVAEDCDKDELNEKSPGTGDVAISRSNSVTPDREVNSTSTNKDSYDCSVAGVLQQGNSSCSGNETDSQTITEALNDCVTRVDMEFRIEEDYFDTVVEAPAIEVEVDSRTVNYENIKPDLDTMIIEKQSTISSKDDTSTSQKLSHLKGEIEEAKQTSIHLYGDNDLISKSTAQTAETPSQVKRKDVEYSVTPGKRVRRANTRDQQHSRQRLNSVTQSTSVTTNQPIKTAKTTSGNSQTGNQPVRQKIFAKWSDNHFYPGTILRPTRDRKFVVNFFDGAQRNVAETDLIPLCNIHGKQVRVSIAKNYCVNAIVHEQRNSATEQPMFDVEYQQDGLVRKCVPLRDIFLTGDQGTPLVSQPDRNSGASNFADVDLDNIIYEKRSRRLQELEEYESSENSSVDNSSNRNRRKRGKYNMRNSSATKIRGGQVLSPVDYEKTPRRLSRNSEINQDIVKSCNSDDSLKTTVCPDSNPPSEGSSSTGSSNAPNGSLEFGQEFYFADSSPHRTKTSLLL